MKIILRNNSAGALLVFILVVAAVVVVGVGGCVAYKATKKLDKMQRERLKDLTNDVSALGANALAEYVRTTGDTQAFVLTTMTEVLVTEGQALTARLLTSTNLVSGWTEIAAGPFEGILDAQAEALRSVDRREPARFFKVEVGQ